MTGSFFMTTVTAVQRRLIGLMADLRVEKTIVLTMFKILYDEEVFLAYFSHQRA